MKFFSLVLLFAVFGAVMCRFDRDTPTVEGDPQNYDDEASAPAPAEEEQGQEGAGDDNEDYDGQAHEEDEPAVPVEDGSFHYDKEAELEKWGDNEESYEGGGDSDEDDASATGRDSACTAVRGSCTTGSCSGSFRSGLCAGAANRRCCVPSGSTPSTPAKPSSGGSKDACRQQILARARQWIGKWYGTDSANKIVCNQLSNFAMYGSKTGGGNKLANGWRDRGVRVQPFPGAMIAAKDGSHVAVWTGSGLINAPGVGKKIYERNVPLANLVSWGFFPSGYVVVSATDGLCNPI